jgi:hypothetical protein
MENCIEFERTLDSTANLAKGDAAALSEIQRVVSKLKQAAKH